MIKLHELFDIAVLRFNNRNLSGAENLFLQILSFHSQHVDAMKYLSQIALERKQFEEAIELLSKINGISKDDENVLLALATAHTGLHNFKDALICLDRVSVLNSERFELHFRYSKLHFEMTNFENAVQASKRALQISPRNTEALSILANALSELRQFENALSVFNECISMKPDNWKAIANKGMVLLQLGNLSEARDSLAFANCLNPLNADVLLPLCGVSLDLNDISSANVILEKLNAMLPNDHNVLVYKGIATLRGGNAENAIPPLIQALAIEPDNSIVQYNLGMALLNSKKFENAITFYERMIQDEQDVLYSVGQKAKAHLLLNENEKALDAIESLQKYAEQQLAFPLWNGEALNGKKILVYSQFGLEDICIFIQFVAFLKKQNATIGILCPEPFAELFKQCEIIDEVFLPNSQVPKFDFHLPLERIPTLCGIEIANYKSNTIFKTNKERVEYWKQKFSSSKKKNVGIMWRNELHVHKNFYHSAELRYFEPLLTCESIQLVTLQTSSGIEELETCRFKEEIKNIGLENSFQDERLASISQLDLLITVDSLTAQVASSAGVPVWIILGKVPAWHYGLSANDSDWHPSAKLFRLTDEGWGKLFENIKIELEKIF